MRQQKHAGNDMELRKPQLSKGDTMQTRKTHDQKMSKSSYYFVLLVSFRNGFVFDFASVIIL